MDENKITISWDELRTRQVEQRVSAMQAMRRNREYAQITDAAPEEPQRFKSLWYNAAVYMSIFGLLGGLAAWACGTMLHFKNSARLETAELMERVQEIRTAADAGKFTPEERTSYIEEVARAGRKNPYFMVYLNESLSNEQKAKLTAQIAERDKGKEFVSNILVFGVSGMLIALALSM